MGNDITNGSFIKSFIPQKISNETAINSFDKLKIKNIKYENLSKNEKNYEHHKQTIKKNNGFIEDQSNYKDMCYGNKTMNYNGCGIIAAFNAIYDLTGNHIISLPLLIDSFEEDGIVMMGIFGTSPNSIKNFFIKQGFETISTTKEEEFDKIGEDFDSFILTFYNDGLNIFSQVHVAHISKINGKFNIHNNGLNCQKKSYNSISDLIFRTSNGKAKGIMLIGMKRKIENNNLVKFK